MPDRPAVSLDANMPALNLADLPVGHVFGPITISITEAQADAYRSATGGDTAPDALAGIVHPLQLDAVAIANLISALGIVAHRIETVHAGQQLTVHRAIEPGETIQCTSTLKSNNLRRGSRWANVQSSFTDANGETVAESASTLILLENE